MLQLAATRQVVAAPGVDVAWRGGRILLCSSHVLVLTLLGRLLAMCVQAVSDPPRAREQRDHGRWCAQAAGHAAHRAAQEAEASLCTRGPVQAGKGTPSSASVSRRRANLQGRLPGAVCEPHRAHVWAYAQLFCKGHPRACSWYL